MVLDSALTALVLLGFSLPLGTRPHKSKGSCSLGPLNDESKHFSEMLGKEENREIMPFRF
jgi:hypothetical protein